MGGKMSKRKLVIGAAIGLLMICVLAVLLAPSDEDGEESLAPTKIAASGATEVPLATKVPTSTNVPTATPSRCVVASPGQMEAIRSGVKSIQESNNVETGWAVKSNDFKNVWMVAAEITGPNLEDVTSIGVWAISGDPGSPGMILSVNGFAKEFTPYPDASETDANITIADDGVRQAEQCVTS
jgi:hypothetical protein